MKKIKKLFNSSRERVLGFLTRDEALHTTLGWIRRSKLRTQTNVANIPCGECHTTTHYFNEELVRQDVSIIITKSFSVLGENGIRTNFGGPTQAQFGNGSYN